MEVGLVHKIDIDTEMQQAYLDYAMSVIVARALPDARDGLKPVHRRILYAMYDMGLRPDSPYKKSARIVGEVLGKYHPHGDMAVYDAMARMAQDFSMRYLLVDGQGNFGSMDGDPPAAMRYTEARLQAPAMHLLTDINKNTVDFDDNFDGSLKEPSVLPAAIPNLLVNGATGIAVGMSTSIPPHNLSEVVAALRYMLDNWTKLDDISLEDLMQFVQGPDFPTGGVIIQEPDDEGLSTAYGTGRGRVTVRARAHLEEMERGRNKIVVTELPYMTNKSGLIERIATLAREERLEGIADLRDESDRQGMRIVIELSRGADPEEVLRTLYKSTPMQTTFSIIMLALVEGEPKLLSLKQALKVYLDHRLEIVRRRSEYDLERARARAHILEGLRVALSNLDAVIELIRKAPDADTARERLMKRFKLTEIQAQAILDMQLRRLAALERKKIEEEYKALLQQIKELESLLASPKKMRQVISDELAQVNEIYGDPRRTQIVRLKEGESKVSLLTVTDLAPDRTVWVRITPDGRISRTSDEKLPVSSEGETAAWLLQSNTRDILYLVSEQGEAAAIPLHQVPETNSLAAGAHLSQISALRGEKRLAALFSLAKEQRLEDWYVITATRQGMVKKSALSELPGASSNTFTLVRVNEGDRLASLRLSDGSSEILLVTEKGMAIRFSEEEVRPMGLVAAGVMGIKLQKEDEVAGMELLPADGDLLMVASDGSAKRVKTDEFPRQGRYGQGVNAWKLAKDTRLAGVTLGAGTMRLWLRFEQDEPKAVLLKDAKLASRAAKGQPLVRLKAGGLVTGLTAPLLIRRPGAGPLQIVEAGDTAPAPKKRATKTAGMDGNSDGKVKAATKKSAEAAGKTKKAAAAKTRTPAVKEPAAKTTAKKASTTAKKTGTAETKSKTTTAAKAKTAAATKKATAAKSSTASKKASAASTKAGTAKAKSKTTAASKTKAAETTKKAAAKTTSKAGTASKTTAAAKTTKKDSATAAKSSRSKKSTGEAEEAAPKAAKKGTSRAAGTAKKSSGTSKK